MILNKSKKQYYYIRELSSALLQIIKSLNSHQFMNQAGFQRILLFLLLFVSSTSFVKSENYEYLNDSLNQVISQTKLDSTEITSFLKYVKKHRRDLKGDYLPLLLDLSQKSEKIEYRKGMIETYNYIVFRHKTLYDTMQIM